MKKKEWSGVVSKNAMHNSTYQHAKPEMLPYRVIIYRLTLNSVDTVHFVGFPGEISPSWLNFHCKIRKKFKWLLS